TYKVEGKDFRNISCTFGPEDAPLMVMGAHYDVHYNNNPGADDNASGVAGVLELARLVAALKPRLAHRLEFVAYTLEEQPHFNSQSMGSQVHAARLIKNKVPLKLMVSVEMIGYFRDEPGTQRFPLAFLKPLYPDRGNFIGVVGQLLERGAVKRVKALMQGASPLPVYSLNAPAFLPEAGFSDHKSYWDVGLPAVMITDTAFLRNPNYHKPTDTPDTLDYARMADVVRGLYKVATEY
ncbi:MAG: M28 family peptidase, partial [Rhizobiales bacterium]|nr:M28 family peptidase [Hyphomicrobiales bacterium]